MVGYSKLVLCLLIALLNFQCTTMGKGALSEEHLRPLKSIRKSIYYALQNSVLRKSQNGRTYYSRIHRPGMNLKLSALRQPEQAQVLITILGDRRPYKINVLYKIDKLNGTKYRFNRYDKSLAKQYLARVEEYLASRPEERDIIDDFRPY